MMTEPLFRDDAYLQECQATVTGVHADGLVLDRTVFYAAGGGQPGDTGTLIGADSRQYDVIDTRYLDDGSSILHVLASSSQRPTVGESVRARIDWPRRHRLMRMHSCMHLLCAVVPHGVTGGQIHDGRGRLDFDAQETFDKAAIEAALNALIKSRQSMRTRWISDAELDAQPELVRTMSVQPPRGGGRIRLVEFNDIDLQPCGGTHVRETGEIGAVRIQKIEKKGKRNRRVTVVFDQDPS